MKILLINHYAGSPEMGMEFRPYYFSREWINQGHEVNIIAADFSHLRRINPQVNQDFEKENIDGINYYWVKTNRYDSNGVKRSLTMFEFISKLLFKTKWIVNELNPDVVICSSTYPLDTYVGQRIKKMSKKHVKLIHEVHDMWPISPIEIGGMSPNHPFIRIMQCGENSFCRNSDVIVSLLPAAKNYFIKHGMNDTKFKHIPNGVVLEEWINYQKLPKKISDHLIKQKKDGKFNICFFGSINKTYNLDSLIEAVIKLNDKNIVITFIGNGTDKKELIKKASKYPESFVFFDPIPKKCIPDLFNYIDASFVGAKSQKIFRFGICMNKLFDSMMGGKPILYMVDAPNDYIEKYSCGISIKNQQVDSLVNGLIDLLRLSDADRNLMGVNGRKAVIDFFNYKVLAKSFLNIMEER